jgi:hypothetical protein
MDGMKRMENVSNVLTIAVDVHQEKAAYYALMDGTKKMENASNV